MSRRMGISKGQAREHNSGLPAVDEERAYDAIFIGPDPPVRIVKAEQRSQEDRDGETALVGVFRRYKVRPAGLQSPASVTSRVASRLSLVPLKVSCCGQCVVVGVGPGRDHEVEGDGQAGTAGQHSHAQDPNALRFTCIYVSSN